MMTTKMNKSLYMSLCGLSLLCVLCVSCNDFLDALPDDRIEIDKIEKVQALLTSAF